MHIENREGCRIVFKSTFTSNWSARSLFQYFTLSLRQGLDELLPPKSFQNEEACMYDVSTIQFSSTKNITNMLLEIWLNPVAFGTEDNNQWISCRIWGFHNVGCNSTDYTASYPRRWYASMNLFFISVRFELCRVKLVDLLSALPLAYVEWDKSRI
jgi:hypothetical protein